MANQPISTPHTDYTTVVNSCIYFKINVFVFHQVFIFLHRETFTFTYSENL